MTTKMSNSSDYETNRNAYAIESEEIELNILKDNKYTNVYVQEYYDDYSDINYIIHSKLKIIAIF